MKQARRLTQTVTEQLTIPYSMTASACLVYSVILSPRSLQTFHSQTPHPIQFSPHQIKYHLSQFVLLSALLYKYIIVHDNIITHYQRYRTN